MLLVAAVPGAVKAGAGPEDVEVGEVECEAAWVPNSNVASCWAAAEMVGGVWVVVEDVQVG